MLGDIWPIGRWAVMGAAVGVVFQLVQIMGMASPIPGWSYNSGRLLGGLLMGTVFGALIAYLRNALTARSRRR